MKGNPMWNKPKQKQLARIPKLYAQQDVPAHDQIVYMHFFLGGCDWYITEFDGEDLFFGFVNLNDMQNAEWGYVSLTELKELMIHGMQIDRDIHWVPKKVGEIEKIQQWIGMRGI